ncbi:MAG: hypothetical protein L6R28_11530 [Planctomycetes bacterium]|nr:hypothetical protein [Planctomycetota bacterium]
MTVLALAAVLHAAGEEPNATAKFLGPEADWAKCSIQLQDIHGLWGGHEITVSGTGACSVRTRKGRDELTRDIALPVTECADLLRMAIKHDLVSLKIRERPGVPDETRPSIVLKNSEGKEFKIAKWGGDKEPRFDAVYQTLFALADRKSQALGEKEIAAKAKEIAWRRWQEQMGKEWNAEKNGKPGCLKKEPTVEADGEHKGQWIVKFEDIRPRPAGDNWVRLKLDAQGNEVGKADIAWSRE